MSVPGVQKPAPIAIVGMSCRLPGQVSNLDEFWTLLSRARSGWCEIPKDRFTVDAYHHPSPQKLGCFNPTGGYFMDRDLSKFDAPFFNITQQEAKAMDPQQRQLLETTYEALENAGIPKETLAGRNMGVFIGGSASDYRLGSLRDIQSTPMFDATGNHQSILSGRIAHYFDFRGPCYTLDTACSSGLHALHQAVQSIRSGESEQAVVAGCRLSLQPDDWIAMSNLGIFSDTGKTHTFDHRAKSGFARGEGTGCLILKPLDQAIKDNDKIRSIIVNTGINQDGRTVGLSTPNGDAQERLMRHVYAQAGISPDDAGFVEAHGTGTKVGDPIEARAIYNVFGAKRTKRQPLQVGSVKTNVGHLENVSGIISVIKAALMLERGFILPNLNFEKANDAIPLDQWNMKVPTALKPWPHGKRFISINNFGFGGSNAHCVLERMPTNLADMPQSVEGARPRLFVLSANDESTASKMMTNLGVYMEQHPEVFQNRLICDIAYTLCQRRSHMPWRIALTASSSNDIVQSLNSADTKPNRAAKAPKLAFVYTGQGAQWATMGRELNDSHPVFADCMRAADDCLQRLGADFSLVEELNKEAEDSQVGLAHISQPACTAVQLALTTLLASWGVQPMAVTGHSSGEIAAAYATGAITLDAAMTAAYFRGQATLKLKERYPQLRGSMLAVGASPEDVRFIIKTMGLTGVTIACENSPGSITASGDEAMIDELAAELENRGTFNRKLRVDMAYHSPHMELVADDYMRAIKDVTPTTGSDVEFFSSLLGGKLSAGSSLGARYWVDNLTRPVLFSSALRELCTHSRPDLIIEIGPHSALEGPVKQILKSMGSAVSGIKYLPSLLRKQNASTAAVKLAGSLFMRGHSLDFDAVNQISQTGSKPAVISDFAPYPWAEHQYWFESRISRNHRIKEFGRHDLLGRLTDESSDLEPTWRNILTTDDVPWLKDHCMQSLTTFPLAGYLTMITEAASQRASMRGVAFDSFSIREVQVSRAFMLDDGAEYETIVTLRSQAEGTRSYSDEWDEVRISSWTEARGWAEHCRALVGVRKQEGPNSVNTITRNGAKARWHAATDSCDSSLALNTFYSELNEKGAGYGPIFQMQDDEMKTKGNLAMGSVMVPDTAAVMPVSHETPSILHTAFLDMFFQLTFAILGAGNGNMQSLYMPCAIKQLDFSRTVPHLAGDKVMVVAQSSTGPSTGPVDFFIDAWHAAQPEEPVISLDGFRMIPVKGEGAEALQPRTLCYKMEWENLNKLPVANGHDESNGDANGTNGHSNGVSNGTNGHANGVTNGHNGTNGHPNGNATVKSTWLDSAPILVTSRDQNDPLVAALRDTFVAQTGYLPSVSSFDSLIPSSETYVCLDELDGLMVSGMTPEVFEKLQKLLLTSSSVLWVSSGAYKTAKNPATNLAQGLLRTVRSESGKNAATLDLDPASDLHLRDTAELILEALEHSFNADNHTPSDFEFAEENGSLVVPRVVEDMDMNQLVHHQTHPSVPYMQDFNQSERRLQIAVGTFGALDSLYFRDEVEQPLGDHDIEIKVAATGMNFKDVVIAMGQVASPYLGVECSGTVARMGAKVTSLAVGDRVCAMSLGAYSTYARCPATSAAVIPSSMSMEVAASIPVVYSTAYYGIMDLARLQSGESILIHAASGGVGQAAIQLAQLVGAEIFATVGSAEKKRLIMEKYGIPEDHIFYSRSTAFGPAIREATNGEGVDVVINSLAGDLLRETWECVAHFGRFIEIGKRDITSNTRLEMAKFEFNATFSSVDLTLVASERPKIMGRVLTGVMALLDQGKVRPIDPITVMGISEVETALRMLQGGKTSGKVIIAPRPGEQVKATHPTKAAGVFDSNATYAIIGGTGGLGRSMAKWMVAHGAKNMVLLSRSGSETEELRRLKVEACSAGASIYIKACDVADEASVKLLVGELQQSLPPIRGVIHAAMVLRDTLFEKMSFEDYEAVVRSKVAGAWNFHTALENEPLDFFVALSSVAGIVGNRGQAAYAAANTYLDALVQHRVQKGMAATSLNLTAISDVGYLAENSARQSQVMQNLSGSTMGEAEVLALLDAAVHGKISGNQCITGLDFNDGNNLPYYASDGKFAALRAAAVASSSASSSSSAAASLSVQQELRQATTLDDALVVVSTSLRDKLSAILMISPEDMDLGSSVTAYGLDSLNAIELRNWVGKELLAHLQVLELLTSGTLKNLAALILKKTRIEKAFEEQAS